LQLEKLIIKNFLSFKLAHLDLLNQGLVLISGLNGSGKSSLTSKAITWGLFGQTPSGLKGDSIENKNKLPTEPTEVIIWLDDGSYIRRGRNPNFVEISGEQFRLASDCQDHINNLINKDFKTFLNTDYFGQDRQIRFLDQSPKFQLELLEEILKLDSLDKYIQKTSEEIKEIEDKLISIPKKEICFSYSFGYKEKRYLYKILRPLNQNWKWISNCNSSIIQGYKQLPEKEDLLFLTSSLKDVISLKSIGFVACSSQSENTTISKSLIKEFKSRFNKVILFLNNDLAGLKAAEYQSKLYNVPYIYFPLCFPKDPSDAIKIKGVDKTNKMIDKMILNIR